MRSVSGSIDYNICRSDIFGYRSMIERYLDSGTLTSLILQGFRNVPIQPILACATLKRVEFNNVAFIDQSPHESITQHALPFRSLQAYQVTNFPYSILKQLQTSLEALDLGYPLPFHQMPVIKPLPNGEFIRFDRLTSLELGSGMDCNWGSLLGRERGPSCKAFPALKHLNVKLFTDEDESAVSAIFDHLQILEGLELKASSPHPSEYLPSLARVITDMNHTLKSLKFAVTHHNFSQELITTLTESFISQPRHDLEHLELHLFFRILEPSEIIPPATQDHDDSYQRCWRKIVSCLKDKVRFPRLHLVDITLCLGLDIEKFKEYEDEVFEAFLREPLQDEGFFESTTGGFEVDIMRWDE
ncbi:hypothetical protein BJ165DRAFT_1452268 [Panaeolus papilionaceus]|nr:hypothetical protein BJ165DRAFT_1452268 [Panaeolus papilionaceus]